MRATLDALGAEIERALDECRSDDDLERVRIDYLGRKGRLTEVMRGVGALPAEERPAIGELANVLKRHVDMRIQGLRERWAAERRRHELETARIDVTLPGRAWPYGHAHPLVTTMEEAVAVLVGLGFSVYEGPAHRGRVPQLRGPQHSRRPSGA